MPFARAPRKHIRFVSHYIMLYLEQIACTRANTLPQYVFRQVSTKLSKQKWKCSSLFKLFEWCHLASSNLISFVASVNHFPIEDAKLIISMFIIYLKVDYLFKNMTSVMSDLQNHGFFPHKYCEQKGCGQFPLIDHTTCKQLLILYKWWSEAIWKRVKFVD